jgi:hypothetical protein
VPRDHLELAALDGVLDQQVLAEPALRAAVADDPVREGHHADHHVLAGLDPVDLGADLDHHAGGLVAQHGLDAHRAERVGVRVHRVGAADPGGLDLHQHVLWPALRRGDLDLLDPVDAGDDDVLHGCSPRARAALRPLAQSTPAK